MKKSSCLVVFVKTPDLTPAKTRLAKEIGRENAEEFYKLAIETTKSVVNEISYLVIDLEIIYAVSELEGLSSAYWCGAHSIWQGNGDLGDRLANVHEMLADKYQNIFFMGADTPHLNVKKMAEIINRFIDQFNVDYLLGETDDGGFYLFGSKMKLTPSVWKSVKYSTDSTYVELLNLLLERGEVMEISSEFDIDHKSDLVKYLKTSLFQDGHLQEQVNLYKWVGILLATEKPL